MASGLERLARLKSVEYGARNVNLYHLVAADGEPLPPAEPGAHIDIEISSNFRRSYSLINSDNSPHEYVIGVLANAKGRGGSQAWHRESVVGNVYSISKPRNNFALPQVDEAWLFAGGIGITPIINMYRSLKQQKKVARLFYWVRSSEDILFADELADDPEVKILITGEEHLDGPKISELVEIAPTHAHLFCCGPSGMLDEYETASASRPRDMVHRERFAGVEKPALRTGFTVYLARQGISLSVEPGQTILGACLQAGVDVPYSCEEGMCGACEASVVDGEVDHRDTFRVAEDHDRLRTMMICCSVARNRELKLDL
ncbi:PDR/VanB family oxidoreductase [Mesorhizobium sp. SP-1A]|uniref:PDR/VanB family oxidoreductase n=1 Tax=Mesorhizobium sp. SP-1A TaxID=3077840 RepID=UPI0028F6E437|nr:PDR/VanB family oxidoreductase [Mesorhizobium sp. SP-1A]